MLFEQIVLPVICIVGVLAILAYAKRDRQREAAIGARKRALLEARAAILSLAKTANEASGRHERDGLPRLAKSAALRGYHYERAAQIVASIPVDRL